jgi:hypothetical protein
MRVAEVYPDEAILCALRRESSCTLLKTFMYGDDPLKRDFAISDSVVRAPRNLVYRPVNG